MAEYNPKYNSEDDVDGAKPDQSTSSQPVEELNGKSASKTADIPDATDLTELKYMPSGDEEPPAPVEVAPVVTQPAPVAAPDAGACG